MNNAIPLETFKYMTNAAKSRITVENELEKGLKEGEHYFTLYWGYSDSCTSDSRWMGTIKANDIGVVEIFLVNEMIGKDAQNDIFCIDGDRENYVIVFIDVLREDGEEDDSDEGITEYLEAELTSEEPEISIFGDQTLWDLTIH